jgi:hypothetical protein
MAIACVPLERTEGSEKRRSSFSLPHAGQDGACSPRTRASNVSPQPWQEYS